MRGEIRQRCDAVRLAWRQGGILWSSKAAFDIKRMMLIAFVYGAALSGLNCFVLPQAATDALDSLIGKYLRTLAR
eukprot:4695822-Pyramimonas_sp.AAC.1